MSDSVREAAERLLHESIVKKWESGEEYPNLTDDLLIVARYALLAREPAGGEAALLLAELSVLRGAFRHLTDFHGCKSYVPAKIVLRSDAALAAHPARDDGAREEVERLQEAIDFEQKRADTVGDLYRDLQARADGWLKAAEERRRGAEQSEGKAWQEVERLRKALSDALDELEGLAVHLDLGPIGSVSEWRYTGRDAARIAKDKLGAWRAALVAAPRAGEGA